MHIRTLSIVAAIATFSFLLLVVPRTYASTDEGGPAAAPADPTRDPRADPPSAPFTMSPTRSARGVHTYPTVAARAIEAPIDGFLSWAVLDRTNGAIGGSANATDTNSTESMIKAWLVADHLRRASPAGERVAPEVLDRGSAAIRDSDDRAAEWFYRTDGEDEIVRRMISVCGLTDTTVTTGWWSRTEISARDAVRMGACLADGRAAGAAWTPWLMDQMRHVRGSTAPEDQPNGGRWGIIDGLPGQILERGVGIKNGWTARADARWHVNCLAIGSDWVLAVLMRYPVDHGLDYGADRCARVAAQLVYRPPSAPPTG